MARCWCTNKIYHDTSSKNVFSNELILWNTFHFLPVQDLKNIRLVCRSWKDMCTPIFQRKSAVKLMENDEVEGSTMKRFLASFSITPNNRVLFKNFKMSLFNLGFNGDAMDAFWEKFGPYMESIEFSWVRFVGVDVVRDIIFHFTPKLRRLSIKNCTFVESFDRERRMVVGHKKFADVDMDVKVNWSLTSIHFCGAEKYTTPPIRWEEIFGAFPNLKDLSFYNLKLANTNAILKIAKECQEKNPSSLQLRKLSIFNGDVPAPQIPIEIMDRLTSLKLPLKELSIDLGVILDYNRIAELLELQQNLLKMTLYRGRIEMTDTVSDWMGFVQFMPNLDTLVLCEPPEVEPPFGLTDMIIKTDINFTQMPLKTKLSTLKIDYDISSADVRKLVCWFPGITRAKLYLENEGFRTVCGEWRKLTELEVLGKSLNSDGITGIVEDSVGWTTTRTYTPVNITNLTDLRKFIMVNYEETTTLDDSCVDEGFLMLPRLNYLELCTTYISERGWTRLYECAQIETLLPVMPGDGKLDVGQVFRKSCYKRCYL